MPGAEVGVLRRLVAAGPAGAEAPAVPGAEVGVLRPRAAAEPAAAEEQAAAGAEEAGLAPAIGPAPIRGANAHPFLLRSQTLERLS